MCVSVGHGLYDKRKILMQMSSNEPSCLSTRQAPLQGTPVLRRLWPQTSACDSPKRTALALTPLPYSQKRTARFRQDRHLAISALLDTCLACLGKMKDT